MNSSTLDFAILLFLSLMIILYTLPRYHNFLPTIPIYNNKEIKLVQQKVNNRHLVDIHFFEITDPSVIHAFTDIVDERQYYLDSLIKQPHILFIINFFKYTINRPRPIQLDPSLNVIKSKTNKTPSYPSGHAFQAYYLAYKLSLRYPEKKDILYGTAKKCDEARVIGGHHYPSDGAFAKKLVGHIENLNNRFSLSL